MISYNCIKTLDFRSKDKGKLQSIVLAALLCTLLIAGGCGRETPQKYSGRVISAKTGKPVAGATVEGYWRYRKEFAPSLDGFYTRGTKMAKTKTNEGGHFDITLGGYSHIIYIHHDRHKSKKLILTNHNKCESLTIRLELGEGYK